MAEVCPYICNNKTDYGYCRTSACINPTHRAPTFTSYDPIEIARQYAPKFDKPVVDMVAVVRCRDCKHKPTGSGVNHDIEFPDQDYRCPCRCEDFWYSWMPDDDWFCANGERKDEVEE